MFLCSPQRVTYISFATKRQRSHVRCFRDPTRGECFAVLGYQDLADNRASLTLLPGRTGGISDPTTCCLPARERSVNSVRNSLESSIEPDTREKRERCRATVAFAP